MSCQWIKAEKHENGIAQLTLARPEKHNALNREMVVAMKDQLLEWNKDNTIRLLLINAEGKSFSAGADLEWMRQAANFNFEENLQDAQLLGKLFELLYCFRKPVITMIDGPAYGGALGVVAASDIAVCTPYATFCLSEVKLGLVPAVISPYIVEAIGLRQACRFALSAEVIKAEKALSLGLVHEVIEEEEFHFYGESLVQRCCEGSPEAQAQTKTILRYVYGKPIDKTLIQYTEKTIAQARITAHGREGTTAFLEKRKPDWSL